MYLAEIATVDNKQHSKINISSKKIFGVITHIQVYSLHDGPGLRTIVFMKGCPLKCKWCCNPECISHDIEIEFYGSKCINCGKCLEACKQMAVNPDMEVKSGFKINKELCNQCGECTKVCITGALKPGGKVISIEDIIKKVKKDQYFYLTSKGGLTISGGEPLYQFEFIYGLLKQSYNENIDNTLETSGFAPWKYYEKILPYLNLVFYDIKHMDSVIHKQWTNVSNKIILNNLIKLSKTGIPIIIRLPLIPQFNINEDNIIKTARFIASLDNIQEVELMPFHQLGKDKYNRLSREYGLKHFENLISDVKGRNSIQMIKNILETYNLNIKIG